MNLTIEQKATLVSLLNAEISELNETHMLDAKIQALINAEKERLKVIVEALLPSDCYRR
jgi:hypothetical protein